MPPSTTSDETPTPTPTAQLRARLDSIFSPPRWRLERRLGWNNWTFGVWWSRPKDRTKAFGVDLGPLELMWRKGRG